MSGTDLGSVLGRSRAAADQPDSPPAAVRRLPAGLIPALVVVGVLAAFAAVTWERWWPAPSVAVVRVTALSPTPGSASAAASSVPTVAFQASGWVEADPHPVRATTRVDGVVEEVLVLEGERVAAGDALARIDPADYRIALAARRSILAEAEAAVVSARSDITAAEAALAAHAARVRAAEAHLAEATDEAERLAAAGTSIGAAQAAQAALRRDAFQAEAESVAAERAGLEAALAGARARLREAEARVASAEVAVAKAELDLERTTIYAPIAGVVQRLYAAPGLKLMLHMDDPNSGSVATLYDPESLQVRVDVPLADAAGLFIGQEAVVDSAILPDSEWRAEVVRIEGQADLTRNTLQAKLAIRDDPRPLRPEMLCRARFFTAASASPEDAEAVAAAASERLELWLPAALAGADEVFVVDPEQRLERRQVEFGRERDGMVQVRSGLRPGEWVVRNPAPELAAGDRVAIEEIER